LNTQPMKTTSRAYQALGAPLQARNTLQPGISVRRPAKEESIGTVEALPPSPAAWNQCWP
ncbi:MAG: hypothetical protein M3Q41_02810, partial [Pseudomonadota bacterium]|nr:hypothetical protein [Pseudomonadota bacterium]